MAGHSAARADHLDGLHGGRRPWFLCAVYANGRYCGRRVAILYAGGDLFACRLCYGLAYASQSENPRDRNLSQAQKIRMRLGGSPSLFDPFPDKPPRMHWRTYERLAARGLAAEGRSLELMTLLPSAFGQWCLACQAASGKDDD